MLLDSHILEKFYKLLEDHKTPQEIHHIKEDVEFRLKTFNVVLLGEYSGGKSSFLNFLLDFDESFGELPFGVLPETKCFWKIRKYDEEGDKNYKLQFKEKQHILRLYRKNGGVVTRYSLVDLSIKNRKNNEDLKNILSEIAEVELIVKNEFIPNVNINIWDMPGTNDESIDSIQDKKTIQKINDSNLCIVVGHARKICTASFVKILKQISPNVKLIFVVRPESNDKIDFSSNDNLKDLKRIMYGENENEEISLVADCRKIKDMLVKENISHHKIFPVQIKNEIRFREFKKSKIKQYKLSEEYNKYLGGQTIKKCIFDFLKDSNKYIAQYTISLINIILNEIIYKFNKELVEDAKAMQQEYFSIEKSIKQLRCPQINIEIKKNSLIDKINELEKTSTLFRNWFSKTPFVVEKLVEYIKGNIQYERFFDNSRSDIGSCFWGVLIQIEDKNIKNSIVEFLKNKLESFNVGLSKNFEHNCSADYKNGYTYWFESNIRYEVYLKQKYAETFFKHLQSELIENLKEELEDLFKNNKDIKKRHIAKIENLKEDFNKRKG